MILEVNHVSQYFMQGETRIEALHDVSFQIQKKENLSIVGPSGSGKTTLLSLLAGLDRPSKGEIKINGTSLGQLSEQELTLFRGQNIGIVFQQFHLIPHLTALENVSLPLEIARADRVQERAREFLQFVGLEQRLHHFPSQLSGGENQRVAIARASILRPQLLLADEPSGNLDTQTGSMIMDLLFRVAQDSEMTLVLVTHDLNLARRCDKELHLVGGRVQ